MLDEKLFHFQHTVSLLGLGQPRVGPSGGLSSQKRPFGRNSYDGEIVEKLTVVEDDLFAALDGVLSVEAEAETLQGLLGSYNFLGLDPGMPF